MQWRSESYQRTWLVAALLLAWLPGTIAGQEFDPTRRIPWTTSRVIGSPEPPPPYRVARTFAQLDVKQPITVAHEPGQRRLLLVHQLWPWVGPGRILRIAEDGQGADAELLLSLDRTIYGIALHPDYERNGYLYVGSNGPITSDDKDIPGQRFRPEAADEKTTRVSRFTVSRDGRQTCDPASELVILQWKSNGHNGGDLAFGADGMLYISAGDGTSDSDVNLRGQDLTHLTAKVLRIDVDHPTADAPYSVPRDNPFLHIAGARPETWAYGLRNPWRLHVDQATGDVWVGNNGQDLWEQIYHIERGANYGWSLVEGTHPFYPERKQGPTPISKPIVEHHHSQARSLTGGLVYHGRALPELRGAYLYGDWSTGKIWSIRQQAGRVTQHRLLADTTLQVAGFGTDSQGELLIVDYGGGLYRLEPTPAQAAPAVPFPRRLSDTGLFRDTAAHRPEPALIPYSVNAPLWSDGAEKERFIALPGMSQMDYRPTRGWDLPEGTVLVKTFSLPTTAAGKQTSRRIETRLLTRQQGEWHGYTYRWNDEQTDALLVEEAGADADYRVPDAASNAGEREQRWHFPSRTECMVCHSRAANFVLGLSTLQMNRRHDYGGPAKRVSLGQIETLHRLGLLRTSWLYHVEETKRRLADRQARIAQTPIVRQLASQWPHRGNRLPPPAIVTVARTLGRRAIEQLEASLRQRPWFSSLLPHSPSAAPRLVDPHDRQASLDERARSYLHANCAQCHVTAGGGNATIDLEYGVPLDRTRLLAPPHHNRFGKPDAALLRPRDPSGSLLLHRMTLRGSGQMPPLATSVVDQQATELLRQWIEQLPSESSPK